MSQSSFIVFNKSDVTKSREYKTPDEVAIYLLGKRLDGFVIIINHEKIIQGTSVPVDVRQIAKFLSDKAADQVWRANYDILTSQYNQAYYKWLYCSEEERDEAKRSLDIWRAKWMRF